MTRSAVTMRSLASEASRSSGKTGVAARDLDQLLDPADAADQRIVPLLEIHGRPPREARGRFADRVEATLELSDQRGGLLRHADDAAEHADHLQDLGDGALVEGEHRIAAFHQLGRDVGLQVREGENQIGREPFDLVEPRVQERRDLGLLPGLGRAHGVARDADHAVTFAEQVQRLGRLFGEADDARGEHGRTHSQSGRQAEVGEGEAIADDGLADHDVYRMREHRAVGDAGVELAALATRIDRRRQLVQQRARRTCGRRTTRRGPAGPRCSVAR